MWNTMTKVSKVEMSRGDFLQLMKYHVQSSLMTEELSQWKCNWIRPYLMTEELDIVSKYKGL